jgi:hypothetical protein
MTPIQTFKKHGAHYYEGDEQEIIDAREEYAEHKTILFMKYIGMSESKEGKTFEELYADFNQKTKNNDTLQN